MDPKLYTDEGTLYIYGESGIEIMMTVLNNQHRIFNYFDDMIFIDKHIMINDENVTINDDNIINDDTIIIDEYIMRNDAKIIIDDDGVGLLSSYHMINNVYVRQEVYCSYGWLDVLFVIDNISDFAKVKIKKFIGNNISPHIFIKVLLIIQVLMSYSECRDINRLLLKLFFDDSRFDLTCDIYMVIDSKWVTYCSIFCGRVIFYYNVQYQNYIINIIFSHFLDRGYLDNPRRIGNVHFQEFIIEDMLMINIESNDDRNDLIVLSSDHSRSINDKHHNIYCDVVKVLDDWFSDIEYDDSIPIYDFFDMLSGSLIDIKSDHFETCTQCSQQFKDEIFFIRK